VCGHIILSKLSVSALPSGSMFYGQAIKMKIFNVWWNDSRKRVNLVHHARLPNQKRWMMIYGKLKGKTVEQFWVREDTPMGRVYGEKDFCKGTVGLSMIIMENSE